MSYGIYLPYIQNTMPRDVFRWMRFYIHFTDNSKCKNKPKDESTQATTWRDKKQVLFLHTAKVGRSNSIDTKRHVKRKQEQITIQSMQSQQEYVQNYGGVNRNGRDSAEYSTTIQTHCWYLCIFFWLFDCIIHMLYMIILYSLSNESSWKKYSCKNYGRARFQMNLGLQLIKYAIEHKWTNLDGPRPSWMRQNKFLSCNSNKCFFCLNDNCNGIYHKPDPTTTVYKVDGKKKERKIKGCTDD